MSVAPANRATSTTILSTFDEAKLAAACREAREELGGDASIVFAFVSSDWAAQAHDLIEVLQIEAHTPHVVGCTADGLIGTAQEDEEVAGATLQFLRLPETELVIERVEGEQVASAEPCAGWIALLDPFEVDGRTWAANWNRERSAQPCFGGLASGGGGGEGVCVFASGMKEGEKVGGVHVGLRGGIEITGVVSQGCRPIGQPYTITEVEGNVIHGIGSQRAYDVLERAYGDLSEEDQSIASGNILAGLAMSEYVDDFKRGDFLVSSILGGDPDAGALAVGVYPEVGQTMQFQLRDGDSADRDLRRRLEIAADPATGSNPPFGALVFSCTGRGRQMFGIPNHDADIIDEFFPGLAGAGFFCNGEIGPVAEQVYVHGFTASIAFLRDA